MYPQWVVLGTFLGEQGPASTGATGDNSTAASLLAPRRRVPLELEGARRFLEFLVLHEFCKLSLGISEDFTQILVGF